MASTRRIGSEKRVLLRAGQFPGGAMSKTPAWRRKIERISYEFSLERKIATLAVKPCRKFLPPIGPISP